MNRVKKLNQLNRKLDESLIELGVSSIVAPIAGHLGANHLVKGMMQPGTIRNHIGASIFQSGVRHAKSGRQIHPILRKAVDALTGPEIGHIYDSGLHSTRASRLAAHASKPLVDPKSTSRAGLDIVTGRRSKIADKIIKKLPTVSADRKPKLTDHVGTAGVAALDPFLAGYNHIRTKISHSSIGKKMMKKWAEQGARKTEKKGILRHIRDYTLTPSISVAKDVGSDARQAIHKKIQASQGRA